MVEFHSIFIILFIIFIIYIYIENNTSDVDYTKSTIDNRMYLVRNLPDKQSAADILAKIRINMEKLCNYLKTKYPADENIRRLCDKFNPDNITETSGNSKYTSYSVNKGEKIVLCLRMRENNSLNDKLIDENTLMFVSLHELSHIMTKSIGHQSDFWTNFKFILENAIEIKIYSHEDYNNSPRKYCGITITDTPLKMKTI